MERGVPVILRAEWQENSDKPCDIGTDILAMEKEWPQFDWSSVDPEYPTKTGLYAFSKKGLTQRGIAARKWLRGRPEKVIAVVSHSGKLLSLPSHQSLHTLTVHSDTFPGFLRVGVSYRQYANADFRIFDFGEGDEEIGGKLIEWELTEKKGGGLGKSPKGVFPMSEDDFPEEAEKDIGEAVSENPS
jgi:hypothetical protein